MNQLFLILLVSSAAWANPNLNLIKDVEWKGTCRKNVNETGQELKNQPYIRLQSSYSFQNDQLIWWVKSFTDTTCGKLHETSKSTLKCTFKSKDEFAACKATKPTVDHAGYESFLEMKVKVSSAKNNKVKIITIGESEEPDTELLSH